MKFSFQVISHIQEKLILKYLEEIFKYMGGEARRTGKTGNTWRVIDKKNVGIFPMHNIMAGKVWKRIQAGYIVIRNVLGCISHF